jgi:serine/threonine-protein kinase SRPK3
MRNRVLSLVLASKSRLGGRLQQRYKSMVHTQLDSTLPMPNISTDCAVENVELTFVEEPLGLRADQGYGYLQVDFGQRIGPRDRYEVLRKLGWGMNVC